jgi:predicted nucleic acid-binding protein
VTVANSSPLIYLAALSDFELLHFLFGRIHIPPAVLTEVVDQAEGFAVRRAVLSALGQWMDLVSLAVPAREIEVGGHSLHAGESDVIRAAQERGADILLMDDRRAVQYARSLGFLVVPTLSIYIRAKRAGAIRNVREKADQLRATGFRLSEPDYRAVLEVAGEL